MSTIFGIWNRNGKPVSNELEIMFSGIQHWPHQRYDFIVKDNFTVGHMLTFNTPEAVHENMPKYLDQQNLIFAAEGRLDNRDELFTKLGIQSSEHSTYPDGDLILQSYLKWGKECVDHLLGKWSLVAFKSDSQDLFIARDQWDYTSINYYMDDNVFAFAPSNKALLPLPFVDEEIDEFMIMRLLIIWPGDFHKTYNKKIQRILPAHYLDITRNETVFHKYWDYRRIEVQDTIHVDTHIDELLESMNLAIQARLRSYKPVAATLSGGMDSSTVCVLTAIQLAEQDKNLHTFSHVPKYEPSSTLEKSLFGDERPFIEAIVEMYPNIKPRYFSSEYISPIQGIKKAIKLFGEPFHGSGNAFWLIDIYTTAAKQNFGTILNGEFGNANISWMGVVDHLPLLHLLRRYGVKQTFKLKYIKPYLYGNTLLGYLYKKNKFGNEPWREHSFLNQEFESCLNLSNRMHEEDFDPTFRRYFKTPHYDAILIYDISIPRLLLGAHIGHELGIELRDPTGDIRVIKKALEIPNRSFAAPLKRQVVRTMMKGKLPENVRMNTKKGRQGSDLSERVLANITEIEQEIERMNSSRIIQYVDIKRINKEWDTLKQKRKEYPIDNMAHLLRTIAVLKLFEIEN
jgi:asparagine synthase (glutamine-hydrolysing)